MPFLFYLYFHFEINRKKYYFVVKLIFLYYAVYKL